MRTLGRGTTLPTAELPDGDDDGWGKKTNVKVTLYITKIVQAWLVKGSRL